jgi:chromosome segregation and condensation protein ScpB
MPRIGHERSATEKALRELLADGQIVVAGTRPTMGRARIYALPAADAN